MKSGPIWIEGSTGPDSYVAFRGTFKLDAKANIEIRSVGASWYGLWVDGEYVNDGPVRFLAQHPEYQSDRVRLGPGEHVIAAQVHHIGLATRLLLDMPPFLWCKVVADGRPLRIRWRCERLAGYRSQTRRVNVCLGWAEWCDTNADPVAWRQGGFDDGTWHKPVAAETELGSLEPAAIGPVRHFTIPLKPVAKGRLSVEYGYELDDPPVGFFLRDLAPSGSHHVGVVGDRSALLQGGQATCNVGVVGDRSALLQGGQATCNVGVVGDRSTLLQGGQPTCNVGVVGDRIPSKQDEPMSRHAHVVGPEGHPAQGVWRRYDLGRVRLGRARLVLDIPKDAVVEIAYCDMLQQGRVSPWITLSGQTCNMDHYIAQGGPQEFFALTPKGGRFTEVHVLAPADKVKFLKEDYVERSYFGEPEGSFSCSDAPLNRIWATGVATYHACAEDALVDCPTRERGEWTGDAVVGMEIGAASYADLRLLQRSLVQAALSARKDGLVAGLCPGEPAYLSTYAAQWFSACLRYYELTGDRALLEEMYPYAERNAAAIEPHIVDDGVMPDLGWGFVDWGYVTNTGCDMAVTMHVLEGMRAIARWSTLIGRDGSYYMQLAGRLARAAKKWLKCRPLADIGYHRAALALRVGLVAKARESEYVEFMKRHMMNCFPVNPKGPRLSGPDVASTQLITPYFAHYALPPLIERGEMDFVLGQYRKCWGWALGDGRTTWLEVFDTRWSHCHQWAGCPTWQLSRYVLGLNARFDLGQNHFVLDLQPGSLRRASGAFPLPTGAIHVDWTRKPDGIRYRLRCDSPIWVHVGSDVTHVEREWTTLLRG